MGFQADDFELIPLGVAAFLSGALELPVLPYTPTDINQIFSSLPCATVDYSMVREIRFNQISQGSVVQMPLTIMLYVKQEAHETGEEASRRLRKLAGKLFTLVRTRTTLGGVVDNSWPVTASLGGLEMRSSGEKARMGSLTLTTEKL